MRYLAVLMLVAVSGLLVGCGPSKTELESVIKKELQTYVDTNEFLRDHDIDVLRVELIKSGSNTYDGQGIVKFRGREEKVFLQATVDGSRYMYQTKPMAFGFVLNAELDDIENSSESSDDANGSVEVFAARPDDLDSESTTLKEAAEGKEAVADEADPMSFEEMAAYQCTVTYRWAGPEGYSAEAVAEYRSACPGYDLPFSWQEMVTTSETEPQALLPASFDCAKAGSSVEKMICGDPSIAHLDGQLAKLYSAARQSSADTSGLKLAQREWLRKRNACTDPSCLRSAYEERIAELLD